MGSVFYDLSEIQIHKHRYSLNSMEVAVEHFIFLWIPNVSTMENFLKIQQRLVPFLSQFASLRAFNYLTLYFAWLTN